MQQWEAEESSVIEITMMLMMKLLRDIKNKKKSLAKQKGDNTKNQQVRTVCDWLDY